MPGRKKLTWEEMKEYWRVHSSKHSNIDFDKDPDGLGNVCHAGKPLWLNKFVANCQERIYKKLFSMLPEQIGSKAIESNISDIAAMGGFPKYALVSLTLPKTTNINFFNKLYNSSLISKRMNLLRVSSIRYNSPFLVFSLTLIDNTSFANK